MAKRKDTPALADASEQPTQSINVVSKSKPTATKLKVANTINLEGFVKACATGGMNLRITRSIDDAPVVQRLTTGDSIVDMLLGGGVPVGKQIEIIGYQSSGKTSLAMEILIQLINNHDGYAYIIDHEDESWDYPNRPIQLGLNPEKLDRIVYGDVDTIESVFDSTHDFIETICVKGNEREKPVFCFVDSIAAFSSKEEVEAEYDNGGYPTQAKVIAKGHRKLRALLAKHNIHNVTFIFLNQARVSIANTPYQAAEIETFGGKAIRFFSAIRIMMEHQKQLAMKVKEQTVPVGIRVRMKVIKNKTFNALQSASLRIMFKYGFDNVNNMLDWIEKLGVMKDVGKTDIALGADVKATPYKLVLDSGEVLYFDKGVSFRQLFKERGEDITRSVSAHFNEMLSKVSQSIAGFDEDPTLYDNIAEIDDQNIAKASTVETNLPAPPPKINVNKNGVVLED